MRVMIADDAVLFREGLARVLLPAASKSPPRSATPSSC
jgi:hypothetical protein